MAEQRVADMTVEQLKGLIAEVVEQQLSAMKTSLLQEISDLIDSHRGAPSMSAHGAYLLVQRTEAEQREINQTLIEWLEKWTEEEDEEEQEEIFDYVHKVLDEEFLSNRPLFTHK